MKQKSKRLRNAMRPVPAECKITIKRHVKCWLVAKYFPGQSEPFNIDKDTDIGRQVMALIADNKPQSVEEENESIAIALSTRLLELNPTAEKLALLGKQLERMFHHDFKMWIQVANSMGASGKDAIEKFNSRYNINEDDYSYETAYKAWMRAQN